MLCLLCSACKKPTDGLTLSIAPQLFEYTAALQFYNAADPGNPPANISIKISGRDAAGIYEISGNKKLTVIDGFIALGLLADRNPKQGAPVQFTLEITAPGYMPQMIPVKILYGQKIQFIPIEMVSLTAPPAGVSVKKLSVPLSANAVPELTTITTPLTQGKLEAATLSIPEGTTFKDDSGNPVNGNTLSVTLLHFDARTAAALNAYAGGRRSSNLIKDAQGNNTSGYFQPGGFVYLQCSIDGKPVIAFTKNPVVTMDISAQQWNPLAGRNFAAGDTLNVFRLGPGTASWTMPAKAGISSVSGKLKAQFFINTVTTFSLAQWGNVCDQAQLLFHTGVTEPENFRIDIYAANDIFTPVYSGQVQVADNESIPFADLPAGDMIVKVYPSGPENPLRDFLKHSQAIGVWTGNACAGNGAVTIDPQNKEPLYFDIEGYCSNSKTYVRPTFYVLYALPGTGDFQMLGLVQNGRFSTRNLDITKTYDFKVIWGGNRSSLVTGKLANSPGNKVTIIIPKSEEASFCP